MANASDFSAGDLSGEFDNSRKEVTGETLEQTRHNYFIAAAMRGSDDSSVGGLNINQSGRKTDTAVEKQKKKQGTDDIMTMVMFEQQLAAIESAMMEKYGEDFAENLAAELLDEETYKNLMQIEDAEERRHAIALAINTGINDGTIEASDVYDNPDVKEWLDTHAAVEDKRIEIQHSNAEMSDGQKSEQTYDVSDGAEEVSAFDAAFAKSDFPMG